MSTPTQDPEPLAYTIRDVAERIHTSSRSVRRAIERGDLEVFRIGRCVRIHRDALMKFLANGGTGK